jgi:L-rhamnose-H+ transport protein
MVKVLVFGFGWGVGSVLFGLGVARLGLAVGYGIILGLIAPIGTFLPLVVLHPDRLYTRQGATLVIGTVIVLAGIVMLARAGKIREHATATTRSAAASGFGTGLVICILSGLFSPMLNFAFVFGEELQRRALDAGASPTWASNAIWCLALTSGCIANAGYCVILLNRNRTWDRFSSANAPGGANWMLGIIMGVICFAGFMTYGTGATLLGPLGGIVGWPLFMSMALITSNLLGAATGEWRGAPRQAWLYSIAGIGLLIVAITIISSGGQS